MTSKNTPPSADVGDVAVHRWRHPALTGTVTFAPPGDDRLASEGWVDDGPVGEIDDPE